MNGVDEAIAAIYEAVLEPGRWGTMLPGVTQLLGAERAVLGFTTERRGHSGVVLGHNLDPGIHARWLAEFDGRDPWNESAGLPPPGTVVRAEELVPWDELRKLDVARAVFTPAGHDTILCAITARHPTKCDYLTVARSHRRGPFEAGQVERMAALAPHLVRAARIQDRILDLQDAVAARNAIFDRLPFGVLLLDDVGRVLSHNAEAERIVRSGDGLALLHGRLCARGEASQATLSAALTRACPRRLRGRVVAPAEGALFALPRPSLRRPYQVLAVPVSSEASDRLFDAAPAGVSVVLVVSDPEAAPRPAEATLRALFGLPPALARLAAALASGRTVREYAFEARVSEGTARQQLKDLFLRTGTRRQAELVRVLLTGVGLMRAD